MPCANKHSHGNKTRLPDGRSNGMAIVMQAVNAVAKTASAYYPCGQGMPMSQVIFLNVVKLPHEPCSGHAFALIDALSRRIEVCLKVSPPVAGLLHQSRYTAATVVARGGHEIRLVVRIFG